MNGGGTDNSAEMPKWSRSDGNGIAGDPEAACQAVSAPDGSAGDEAPTLLEEVLRRDNLRRAYERVRSNGGAPGVDGMTVQELPSYLQQEWDRIREQLLSGTYQPQPVRKVAIPKPGGGIRTLGIPTVLDRLIQQAVLQVLQPRFEPYFRRPALASGRAEAPMAPSPRPGSTSRPASGGPWIWTWRSSSIG